VLLLGVAKVVGSVITGRGRPRYAFYSAAITAPLTLALYFGLIPPFHAWGAAIASSVSYAGGAVLGVVFFRRVTTIGLREAFLPTRADLADYRLAATLARSRLARSR
jgi:O-antigen/teichoic acid export membrane protein